MDTPSQALKKLQHFCSYQDRCHTEVKEKLRQLGLRGDEADQIMATLITEDYLNEERFAKSFARGKFRMKKWGRGKITQALRFKGISVYCIRKGLEEIDDDDYREALFRLASDKYNILKGEQYLRRRYKTTQYLLGKGYEPELIREILAEVISA